MTGLDPTSLKFAMKAVQAPTPQEELAIRQKRLANMVEELKRLANKCTEQSRANMERSEHVKAREHDYLAMLGDKLLSPSSDFFAVAASYRNMSLMFQDHADRIEEINASIARFGLKF